MTIKLELRNFLAFALLSCVSCAEVERADRGNIVASEAVSEHAAHGYWENPDVEYVSTSWPIDETNADDNIIDIRSMHKLEKGYIDTTPADRNDGLQVGELGVDGGNKEMIIKLAQEISDGAYGDLHSLLIIHKDKFLFESYFNRGRLNVTHPQASTTKTYTSLALGRAIQMGYLTMEDLDRPVISFLDELDSTSFVEGADKVTLRQALTMRTGIRISDEQTEEYNNNPDQIEGQKLVQAIFEQSAPITEESQSAFSYGNYGPPLVMQVIDTVIPDGAEAFLKNELLGKIGVSTYEWRIGLGGIPAAGWKSSFASRAMAKVGILAMNKGKWNGEQLIPEAYMTEATSRIVSVGDDDIFGGGPDVSNQGYGYFFWSGDLKSGDKTYYSASAQGGGGQFIILIDELDLVVVITSGLREPEHLQITAERILPAFVP